MRFYKIVLEQNEEMAIAIDDTTLVRTSDLGISCKDFYDCIKLDINQQSTIVKYMAEKYKDCKKYNIDDVKVLPPVAEHMQDIICLGVNYYDHAAEIKDVHKNQDDPAIYFSKRFSKPVGDKGYIPSHNDIVNELDYEAELLVIIGTDVYKASKEEAQNAIWGYSIINDVSARDIQTRHKQWYRGKSMDGFTAIGPCLVTADEIDDAQNLDISCTVNGEIRQRSNTKYMIKTIADAIVELSAGMTLSAGTMIATGTPGGVGKGMKPPCFLKHGDVVKCQVEKIGILTNTIE